jgi:hypothetical protein
VSPITARYDWPRDINFGVWAGDSKSIVGRSKPFRDVPENKRKRERKRINH